jgi:hypothetical protein
LNQSRIDFVINQTQQIRNLSLKKKIEIKIFNKEQLRAYFEKEFQEEYPEEKLKNLEKAYKKIGLIPQDANLLALLSDFKADEVVGIYDDVTKEIYLVNEARSNSFSIELVQLLAGRDSISDMVLSHEMTHALQDQHFDLKRIGELCQNNQDFDLATSALIEGDADYTSQGLLNPLIIPDHRRLGYLELPEAYLTDETLRKSPKFLVIPFVFQYLYGAGFIHSLIHTGPASANRFDRINAAFANLPKSTEQIIHPKKYHFQPDQPTPVTLAKVKALLPNTLKVLEEETMGQLIMGVWVAEHLGTNWGYRVSEGWDGDRYAVLEDPASGRLIYVQLAVFDAEIDSIQYFDACKLMVPQRNPNFVLQRSKGDWLAEFVHQDQRAYIKRIGTRVAFVDGVSAKELDALREPLTEQLAMIEMQR